MTMIGVRATVGKSVLTRAFSTTWKRPGSVKLQVLSDLHLESQSYPDFPIPRKAPYLVLAGDIGNLVDAPHYLNFLTRQCSQFEHVYLVLGNHEFFKGDWADGIAEAARLQETLKGKLSILYRQRADVPDSNVTILGCTLHSNIPKLEMSIVGTKMMDFRRIGNWRVRDYQKEHKADVKWLQEQVASMSKTEPERRIVIVTHHAPSKKWLSDPVHENSRWGAAFSTEILRTSFPYWEGRSAVVCWIFGHTHWNVDFRYGRFRVVSNQRGIVARSWIPPSWGQARHRWRGKMRYWIARLLGRTRRFDVGKVITV